MSLFPGAFALVLVGFLALATLIAIYRAIETAIKERFDGLRDAASWWKRYAASVGGEDAARMIVAERERSNAAVDDLLRRGFKQAERESRFLPKNFVRLRYPNGRAVRFSDDGGDAA